jgi:glycosyltransferase involved in cell wall biosynthesis
MLKIIAIFACFFISSCGQKDDYTEVFDEIEAPLFFPKKTFGVVITAFNRPEYLKRTLESLKQTSPEDLSRSAFVIIDDASTDPETKTLIEEFRLEGASLYKFMHKQNSGIVTGLFHGFKFLNKNVEYVLNIDADVLVNPKWLSKLQETYEKINDKNSILTGFNTKNHETVASFDEWHQKKDIGGINFFMSAEFYQERYQGWFKDYNRGNSTSWKQWDWFVVNRMADSGFKFYATKPSVIQHIGFSGLNSNGKNVDVADDFVP